MKFVLASASPRRKELLAELIQEFEIIPAKGEEKIIGNPTPPTLVQELACQKATEVATLEVAKGKAVLGSDTIFKIIHENANVDFMAQYLENVGALQSKYAMRKELKNLKATFQPVPAGVVTPFDVNK